MKKGATSQIGQCNPNIIYNSNGVELKMSKLKEDLSRWKPDGLKPAHQTGQINATVIKAAGLIRSNLPYRDAKMCKNLYSTLVGLI